VEGGKPPPEPDLTDGAFAALFEQADEPDETVETQTERVP
jgi:hypothetical protein